MTSYGRIVQLKSKVKRCGENPSFNDSI